MAASTRKLTIGRDNARKIVEDPLYQTHLLARAQTGDLSPQMEVHLWDRAYGKVAEEVIVKHLDADIEEMTLEELAAEARVLEAFLREQGALERTNDVDVNTLPNATVN